MLRRLFRKKNVSQTELKLLTQLEDRIGYVFRDLTTLKRALSHKSYANENKLGSLEHNERFEFLGDAVLELGISDFIMHYFPDANEGDMSKLRASLVNETSLSEIARNIDLGSCMFLSKGEEQCQGREKNSLLADALEAMLGAIYLDGGFGRAFKAVREMFLPTILKATKEDISRDYKTKLQEEVQNRFKLIPQYRLVNESGPDHEKVFDVHLYISGKKISEGRGKSKKQAEQIAAQNALTELRDAEGEVLIPPDP